MARQKKETRPGNAPVAVRFTVDQNREIEDVAKDFQMSKQDVIRLSVAAGLKAMKRIGLVGIQEFISEEIRNPGRLNLVAEEPGNYESSSNHASGDPVVDQDLEKTLDQTVGEIEKASGEGLGSSLTD